MKQISIILVVASLLLLPIITLPLFDLDTDVFRWLRLLNFLVLFIVFLQQIFSKDVSFIAAFSSFLVLNICLMNYEIPGFRRGFYISGILGYSFLIFHVWPKIKDFEATLLQKILVGFVFLLDGALVLFLHGMLSEKFDDLLVEWFFISYGVVTVLLMILAIYFSDRYNNRPSFFFLIAILGLILSDVTLFIAYYLEYNVFYIPSSIFYLLGLACLIKFSSLTKNESFIPALKDDFRNYL